MIEVFAGTANTTRCFRYASYKAVKFDILYENGKKRQHKSDFMNILDSSGFLLPFSNLCTWCRPYMFKNNKSQLYNALLLLNHWGWYVSSCWKASPIPDLSPCWQPSVRAGALSIGAHRIAQHAAALDTSHFQVYSKAMGWQKGPVDVYNEPYRAS